MKVIFKALGQNLQEEDGISNVKEGLKKSQQKRLFFPFFFLFHKAVVSVALRCIKELGKKFLGL